jgi:hypothetical protein
VSRAYNSGRMPPFHQLDVRVDKRWVYESWMLTVYADIQNTFDRHNPEGIEYNFDYTQHEYVSGLPLILLFGVRGEF